jgi:hypothetical protein
MQHAQVLRLDCLYRQSCVRPLYGWSKHRRAASEFGVWSWWPVRREAPPHHFVHSIHLPPLSSGPHRSTHYCSSVITPAHHSLLPIHSLRFLTSTPNTLRPHPSSPQHKLLSEESPRSHSSISKDQQVCWTISARIATASIRALPACAAHLSC